MPNKVTGRYWDEGPTVVRGCTKVSEGCKNCWSIPSTRRYQKGAGFVEGNEWTGKIECRIEPLLKTMKGKPKVISLWNDLFHQEVPRQFQNEVLHAIHGLPHKFLVLTKRAFVMASYLGWAASPDHNLNNIWWGATIENQAMADLRIPQLLQVPGHKWISLEPLLEPLEIDQYMMEFEDGPEGGELVKPTHPGIEWIVVGPETGPKRRECKPEWIKSIIDQCDAAGVQVWVKAFPRKPACGSLVCYGNCKECTALGNIKISHDMAEWPEWARRRELPWKVPK